ncbi:hypothetical protein [Streptomyces griseoruber]|nr:hypothetical protein [Streptomyces griseoruber]
MMMLRGASERLSTAHENLAGLGGLFANVPYDELASMDGGLSERELDAAE